MVVKVKNVNAPATEAQIATVSRLAREIHGDAGGSYMIDIAHVLTNRQATSDLIGVLIGESKALRAAARAAAPKVNLADVKPGFYAEGDDVYRVKPGKRYAEKMVPGVKGTWAYAKGAIYRIAALEPMTKEQAAEMGRRQGVCIRCGAYLEAEGPWRALGQGPVCAKKPW